MKFTYLLFFLFATAIYCSTKWKVDDPPLPVNRQDSSPNSNQGAFQDYFFVMEAGKVEEFSRKINAIELGTTMDEVISVLGPPNAGPASHGKKLTNERWMEYYVVKWRRTMGHPARDKVVWLDFDENTRLVEIESTVAGIESRRRTTKWESPLRN